MNANTDTSLDAMTPTVGGYRVGERLGEGGMGEVFRAVDTMLEREVALKVLRPEMGARADLVERFRVEAIALARLHHRHIAAVFSFFQERGQHYIAMQYVRGRTLESVLQQRGPLPWREAAAVAMDVLQALEHAHALGVVHRDLKPANLMIDADARTVVMDFGIARVMARSRQTRAGTLVGTLEYIAPEIVRGEAADARSDLYSLGCVMYEMVTGALPFDSPSDFALMRAHAEQAPPRPIVRCGDLPPALEAIILRALEKQPAKRYASARAFLDALSAVVGTAPHVAKSRQMDVADALRHSAAVTRERASAALRWLDLPAGGGWPAWRAWARLNLGLASAAGVAAGALVLALAMGTHQVCCSAPPAPTPWQSPLPPLRPAALADTADSSASLQTWAQQPATTLVAEPVAAAQVGPGDPPPMLRSVRAIPAEPAAPPSSPKGRTSNERPAQPGWYVKR